MASAGRFVWWDLMTVDIEKSAVFFASLLELEILQPEDDPSYLMLALPGTEEPIFGLVPIESDAGVQSHWLGYVAVPDLGASLAQVEELGGAISLGPDEDNEELDVQIGIVTDPQGSVFGLMTDPGTLTHDDEVRPIGHVNWIELLAADRDRAGKFYAEVFGWEVGPEHERADEGTAQALFHGDRVFGLLRDLPPGSPVPPHWAFYLRVPDIDQAIVRARQLGGFMYEDPANVDGGRRVIMLDPTGAPVTLWQVG